MMAEKEKLPAYDVLTQAEIDALERRPGGAVLYPLAFPAEARLGESTETVHDVTLRRPKGKDLRALDLSKGASVLVLDRIERLTGLDRHIVDEIDEYDISAIGDILESFGRPGRATGKTA